MRKVEKPWGYEIIWAETDKYVGKKLFIKKGEALSKQYHEVKDETIFILEGTMKLELGDREPSVINMVPDDSYHIAPNIIHRMVAVTDVTLCEVSTTELDDVVRLEDRYGRT